MSGAESDNYWDLGMESLQDRNRAAAVAVDLLINSQRLTDDPRWSDEVTIPHDELENRDGIIIGSGNLRLSSNNETNLVNLSSTALVMPGGANRPLSLDSAGIAINRDVMKPIDERPAEYWGGRGEFGFDKHGFEVDAELHFWGQGRWIRDVYRSIIFAASLKSGIARLSESPPGTRDRRVFSDRNATKPYVLGAIALDHLGPQAYDLADKARPEKLVQQF